MDSDDDLIFVGETPAPAQSGTDPSMQMVVDMGYSTSAVIKALAIKKNNVDEAANLYMHHDKGEQFVLKMQLPTPSRAPVSVSDEPSSLRKLFLAASHRGGSGARSSSSTDIPAAQLPDEIHKMNLGATEPSAFVGKRPRSNSPGARSSKKHKPDESSSVRKLFLAASHRGGSGASSSSDFPPQQNVPLGVDAEGSGSSGSKESPPKNFTASSSSSSAARIVVPIVAESTTASATDLPQTQPRARKSKSTSDQTNSRQPSKSPQQWLELQHQGIAEVSTEHRTFPADVLQVPSHPSNAHYKHFCQRPSKPAIACVWNREGQLVQPSKVQTLLDVALPLDKKVCIQSISYWWHQGRGPYPSNIGQSVLLDDYKWKSRFDHLYDYKSKAPSHVGQIFNHWAVLKRREVKGRSYVCPGNSDVYTLVSLANIAALRHKVLNFLNSIGETAKFLDNVATSKLRNENPHLFWGVIDERAISSLALPVVLMQNPKHFGASLQRQAPHAFGKWFSISEDMVKKCQEFSVERDMLTCLELADITEEVVKGQSCSAWFRDGSVSDQPFLFQQGKQPKKSFCEVCGKWVRCRKDHLVHCLGDSWKHEQHYRATNNSSFQSMRMFQQTLGIDIGATIQFKYIDSNNVQVKLCAEFESLLRYLLFVGYWPHDKVTARWRIVSKPCAEDIVATSHRVKEGKFNFTLKNSLDMPEVPSPSCFVYPLVGEQPYTLSWMFYRESRREDGSISSDRTPTVFKGKECISRRIAGSDVKVEVEIERSYDRIRGGILGDQVGYGKTACMIALIAQTHRMDPIQTTIADWEAPYAKEYIFTDATLIVTPPNLFDQWSNEFKKFVDESKCNLKIITICNHTYMKKYKMKDFVDADVVLVSFRFFFSGAYRKYFDKDVGSDKSEAGYLTSRIIKCRHRVFDFLKKGKLNELLEKRALFESFYWKRVVFDEFHETVQVEADSRETKESYCFMRQLHSRYHWGLTATPLISNVEGIRKMASLLHIFLPKNLDEQNAQHFVDEYLRANKWNVGDVPMVEKWMKVTHTAAERGLYLHQERNMLGENGLNQLQSNGAQRLLQFCSHFSPDGRAQSAGGAIEQVRTENLNRQDRLRRKITKAQGILDGLQAKEGMVPKFKTFVQKAKAKFSHTTDGVSALVHSKESELVDLLRDCELVAVPPAKRNLLEALNQDGRKKCGHNYCNLCSALRTNGITPDSYQDMLRIAERNPRDLTTELKEKEAALRYLDSAIKSVSEVQEGEEAPECSLCMEEMRPDQDVVITQCGHAYHGACLRECLHVNSICPLCRAPTTMTQCTKVREISLTIDNQVSAVDPQREELREKVGSKILAIVDLIESTKKSEKILIFIQWNSIRNSLANAIEAATGPHVLEGDTHRRNKTLKAYQQGTEAKDRILMLSIEQSATGVNLVCANHCILVHPMFGNHKHATDCEKQAIGRIRRQGQQRTCFVYRFYTEGTIEERLMKEHSKELKNMPMIDEAVEANKKLNRFKEPPVVPKPLNAHELAVGVPRCGSCDGNMDFCEVGCEKHILLTENRKCFQDNAKQWVCNGCEKEFDSETTSRHACVDNPECDYDLCVTCYNGLKGDDLNPFSRISVIKATYMVNGEEVGIGLDSSNDLVCHMPFESKAVRFEREDTDFGFDEIYKRQSKSFSRYSNSYETRAWKATVPYNTFERNLPPHEIVWKSYRMCPYRDVPMEITENWLRVRTSSENVPDPSLSGPFNVPDPKLKKQRK